jgi:hypothetical protein
MHDKTRRTIVAIIALSALTPLVGAHESAVVQIIDPAGDTVNGVTGSAVDQPPLDLTEVWFTSTLATFSVHFRVTDLVEPDATRAYMWEATWSLNGAVPLRAVVQWDSYPGDVGGGRIGVLLTSDGIAASNLQNPATATVDTDVAADEITVTFPRDLVTVDMEKQDRFEGVTSIAWLSLTGANGGPYVDVDHGGPGHHFIFND